MTPLRADPIHCRPEDLEPAADWLRSGRVVAFPTDTFYGLAADPRSADGVDAIFALKGRASESALPLVAASLAQVEAFCGSLVGATAVLARMFWPGPLSLVMTAPPGVVAAVHGGAGTIAIRVPDHAIARALAAALGRPVTATSANVSGEPPVRSATQLGRMADDPRVLVIDGGETSGRAASTIVDARDAPVRLLRAGAIAWNRVLESLKG